MARCGLSLSSWYLDDCALAGNHRALNMAVHTLISGTDELGLTLNTAKCKLLSVAPAGQILSISSVPHIPFTSGISVLGAPVGSYSFVSSHLDGILGSLTHALDRLTGLHCPQSASMIARSCLGAAKITIFSALCRLRTWLCSPSLRRSSSGARGNQ